MTGTGGAEASRVEPENDRDGVREPVIIGLDPMICRLAKP